MQNSHLSPSLFQDIKIKFKSEPRSSLEKIFNHYLNSSENEILKNEKDFFKNIFEDKNRLITTKYDVIKTIELMAIFPYNQEVLELYSIVKERYSDSEIDIKTLEKQRFKELVSMHNPPLNLCMLLLGNIENFNFEEDYEIIKKLNLNKSKSENARKIYEKTYEKFLSSITYDEKTLLENRLIYDEKIKKFNSTFDSKDLESFLKKNTIVDNYILNDLNEIDHPAIKKLLEDIKIKSAPISGRLGWGLSLSSSPSPTNSAPTTPQSKPQITENSIKKLSLNPKNQEGRNCIIS